MIIGDANPPAVNPSNLELIWKRRHKDVKVKMMNSIDLWKQIDFNKKLVIYSSGWQTNFTQSEPDEISLFSDEFQKRADVNFVVSQIKLN